MRIFLASLVKQKGAVCFPMIHRSNLFILASLGLLGTCAAAAEPASGSAVATIRGQTIPYSVLQTQIQGDLDSQAQQHELQIARLNASFLRTRQAFIEKEAGRLVDDRVLELEAAARKTNAAALLSAVKVAPVSDDQVRAFYDSKRAQIPQPFEQISPKIKEFLQHQAVEQANRTYLDSLRSKYQAAVAVEPLREAVGISGPERGPENAPVTIVEFSDFQCPYCGRFTPVLKQVLAAYPTQVRLVYRFMPIASIHPDAQKAAEAAVCASDQAKFWEMHDTLFSEQSSLDVASLKEKARRLGLDGTKFDQCLDSGQAAVRVKSDLNEAEHLGIEATPASFVNGRFVDGAVTFDQMRALIDDELRLPPRTAHR